MRSLNRDTMKVLIAEDDAWLREMLGFLLAEEGLCPVEVSNGPETVEVACQEHPDVIVLDVGLPGRSGFDVLADLREEISTRDTPVMLISGETNIYKSGHAFDAEAVLHKPLDFGKFLATIREAARS